MTSRRKSRLNARPETQTTKTSGRSTVSSLPKPVNRKRKSTEPATPENIEEGSYIESHKSVSLDNQVIRESGLRKETVDEVMDIESELNQAFDGFDDGLSDDALEELFNDALEG